ncbi:hypothetical protein KCH_47390 [Kitasatospora cheerisanensis KCTC 2395]|uniref:Uncharacterized protein n=1 Tax=Kitasatospora cheerisanensis KCTC 2395 TaxID=1348663 RepID=A0A066YPW7_9ACTN|nr:hypothetical protein KCH_47390 [Kitasatospora cheerisanensis KCTC 2395]
MLSCSRSARCGRCRRSASPFPPHSAPRSGFSSAPVSAVGGRARGSGARAATAASLRLRRSCRAAGCSRVRRSGCALWWASGFPPCSARAAGCSRVRRSGDALWWALAFPPCSARAAGCSCVPLLRRGHGWVGGRGCSASPFLPPSGPRSGLFLRSRSAAGPRVGGRARMFVLPP